ncbi:MAG TPA: sugar phosphate isomerase/epimerase family protein [Thermomicrobiales bacterium]|nr:sugar phosphate isomerase/epimerase family protein [Thermomicrobiales bacterium]
MYNALLPGAIGIKNMALPDLVKLAAEAGYAGVNFEVREAKALADEHGIEYVKALFTDNNLKAAGWGIPVHWQDDTQRDQQLAELPAFAEVAVALGATNGLTGIMPGNNERPFDEQYAFIMERFKPMASVLKDCGVDIGIEFISPKTLRDKFQYEFIYSMKQMLAFAQDVGTGNVGVLFDVWHHYTSHGTIDEIDNLRPSDVLYVHVNDAPTGLEIDEQQDLTRALPMATGVIDAPEMLRRLAKIGYDGPVAAEPFSIEVNDLAAEDPLAAAKVTAEATQKLLEAAGLA